MRNLANAATRLKAQARRRRGLFKTAGFKALPALWLMTDTRMTDPVSAVMRLPRGSGVIVRHGDAARQRALALTLLPLCRRRGLRCLIANNEGLAARLRADGVHFSERAARRGHRRSRQGLLTVAAHSVTALHRAARLKPDAVFVSPVFPTQSHPDAATLGPIRFAQIVRTSALPIIALGGIDAGTVMRLHNSGAAGLAGISWALD